MELNDRLRQLVNEINRASLKRIMDYGVPVNAWKCSIFWRCLDNCVYVSHPFATTISLEKARRELQFVDLTRFCN